jgi:outer membrane receptor protein involved in Fe transport
MPALLFAGVTGKIRGKVVDRESKEPLVGANVALEGTSMGARTDVDGEYTILSVPAGTYSVKASFVGYASTTVSNVRVNADLTTSLDFSLATEAIQVTGVEITAERPLINKSATNAVRIVSGDELANIPVRGVAAIVALQAGVVEQGGQVFIRGGRQDEVGYYVDGADARDARTGAQLITVVPEAVEEFQVQAGGYNAEYGGANAGIIRQQLKTGSNTFGASLRVETDNFVDRGKKYLGGYSYGYTDYSGTVSGPLFSDNIKFFLAGQNTFQADPTAAYWDGFTFKDLVEDVTGSNRNPNNPLVTDPTSIYYSASGGLPTGRLPDTLDLVVLPGNVSGRKFQQWAGNGTLTFDANPFIVRLSGSINYTKTLFNPNPIRNIFNEARLPNVDVSNGLYSAKITHFVQPQTYYDVTLSYSDQRFKRYDPFFKDDYLAYGDSTKAAKFGMVYFGRFRSPQDIRVDGFPFTRPGSLNFNGGATVPYFKRKQSYMSGAVDLTHQFEKHELKGGFSYREHRVRNYSIGGLEALLGSLLSNPDAARNGGTDRDLLFRTGGLPNNYGYDIYGNETSAEGLDGVKKPKYISAYLQDKFEVDDLVINAGLRFDSFNNDDYEFIDPKNPPFDPQNATILASGTRKVPAFKTVSPRLGFSFPVTDRTVFHVQYGKFVQAPQLVDIYNSTAVTAFYFLGRNFISAPNGFGLKPIRTTQYEIGFTQQFTDFASFDLTTFYKDIQGQIQYDVVTTTPGSQTASYNTLQNGDFATTKGLEVTLRLRRTNRIQAAVNYTLSDAQGTGSSRSASVSSVQAGPERPTVLSPLAFNQTHRGSVNVDYRFGKDDGGSILERLGANLLFTFNSGHAYTKALQSSSPGQRGPEEAGILSDDDPRTRKPDGAINSSTTPWVFQVDLRLDKTISIADMFEVNLYLYVQNLLDTKNVLNVYSRSGNATDDGFLSNPALSQNIIAGQGPRYVELYQAINNKNRQHYWQNQLGSVSGLLGADLYGTPRQVRVGLSVVY